MALLPLVLSTKPDNSRAVEWLVSLSQGGGKGVITNQKIIGKMLD